MALPKPQLARKNSIFELRAGDFALSLPNTFDSDPENRGASVYLQEIDGVDGAIKTRDSTFSPISTTLSGVLFRIEDMEKFKKIIGFKEVELRKNTNNIIYDSNYEPITDGNNEVITINYTIRLNGEVSGYQIKEIIIDKIWEFEITISSPQYYWLRDEEFTTDLNPATVTNTGDFLIYPVLRVTGGSGGATGVSISINSGIAEWSGTLNEGSILLIDCDNITASIDGNGVLGQIDSEFYTNPPSMTPGVNEISATITGNADFEVIYQERIA